GFAALTPTCPNARHGIGWGERSEPQHPPGLRGKTSARQLAAAARIGKDRRFAPTWTWTDALSTLPPARRHLLLHGQPGRSRLPPAGRARRHAARQRAPGEATPCVRHRRLGRPARPPARGVDSTRRRARQRAAL